MVTHRDELGKWARGSRSSPAAVPSTKRDDDVTGAALVSASWGAQPGSRRGEDSTSKRVSGAYHLLWLWPPFGD